MIHQLPQVGDRMGITDLTQGFDQRLANRLILDGQRHDERVDRRLTDPGQGGDDARSKVQSSRIGQHPQHMRNRVLTRLSQVLDGEERLLRIAAEVFNIAAEIAFSPDVL